MDWEAPADGWYVWLAVSVISLAMAGVVLGLPTGPPPDADRAANAIERASGSTYEAAATVEHDADEVNADGKTIAMRNEHGTDRSSVEYGQFVVVNGEDRLERIVRGEEFESAYEEELEDPHADAATAFMDHVAKAEANNADEWVTASGEVTVRQVTVEPDDTVRLRASVSESESVDLIADSHHLPETVRVEYEGFDDDASVRYTVDGESVITNEYGDSTSFWERVEDAFSDWVESASCWLADCEDDGDPRDELNPQTGADTDRSLKGTLHRESGRKEIDLDRNVAREPGEEVWVGDYPLTVTASFDDTTCRGEIERSSDTVDLCPLATGAGERADELDWIELNEETGEYHVTLVVV